MKQDEIKVEASYRIIDVRRNKEYGKVCELAVRIPAIPEPQRGWQLGFHPINSFRDELNKRLPDAKIESIFGSASWRVNLSARISADRPKNIASDAEARSRLPIDAEIKKAVASAYTAAKHETRQIIHKCSTWNQAMLLLSWFNGDCKDAAKVNMRFEQRLAALCAEFQAEVKAVVEKDLEGAVTLAKHDEQGRFNENAIILFERYAKQYVEEHKGDGLREPFPRECNDNAIEWIKKQVEPEEDKTDE